MSSSFPTARFPALPLSQEKADSLPVAENTPQAPKELADEALLAQISAGDQEALAVLFRRYARLVWSVAERIVRNKAEADDLLQDVFLLLQRRASVFDSARGTARSLIVHMTYQRALSRRRYLNARHGQASKEAEEQAAKIAAPAAPRCTLARRVRRALASASLANSGPIRRSALERPEVQALHPSGQLGC